MVSLKLLLLMELLELRYRIFKGEILQKGIQPDKREDGEEELRGARSKSRRGGQ